MEKICQFFGMFGQKVAKISYLTPEQVERIIRWAVFRAVWHEFHFFV